MSSPIQARCRCGREFHVSVAAVGKTGRCPACGAELRLVASRFTPGEDHFDALLLVEAGPAHVGEQVMLGGPGPIEVGKSPGRDIELAGQRVSRLHCRLVRVNGRWRIEDVHSTNGLFVNAGRIGSQELTSGDRIDIGEYTLRFLRMDGSAAPAVDLASLDQREPQPSMNKLDELLRGLTEGEALPTPAPSSPRSPATSPPPADEAAPAENADEPLCPSCRKPVDRLAWFCPFCGARLRTAPDTPERPPDEPASSPAPLEPIIGWLCWLLPVSLCPLASERLGRHRVYAVSGLAAVTVAASVWFWMCGHQGWQEMQAAKNCILWSGRGRPDAAWLSNCYANRNYGDNEAFQAKLHEIMERPQAGTSGQVSMMDLVLAAHEALPPEQQATGEYRRSQLFTYAFVHADVVQLVLGLLVLLVIGARINALIGNVATLIAYPLLAAAGGAFHAVMAGDAARHPTMGSLAAAMGLVGMYLVLLSRHQMPMMLCYRQGAAKGLGRRFRTFAVYGFWIALAFILADIAYTLLKLEGNVGHWAQLGAFATGAILGFVLLATRAVDARGGDLLSVFRPRSAVNAAKTPEKRGKALLDRLP